MSSNGASSDIGWLFEDAQPEPKQDARVEFDPQKIESVVESSDTQTDESIAVSPSAQESDQISLIDLGTWWEEHWKGMPEFVQEDATPYKTIYVHFEKREDMEAFAQLVAQRIGLNTLSIWYPEMEINDFSKKRYVDKPPEKITEGVETFEDS